MVQYNSDVMDCVVIGAGAGGGVAASHLASAKRIDKTPLKVMLLEAGPRIEPEYGWDNYSDLPINMLFMKYQWPFNRVYGNFSPIMLDEGGNPNPYGIPNLMINYFCAQGLGGTTQMYLANSPRLPKYILDQWPIPEDPAFTTWEDELSTYYLHNEKMLDITQPMGHEKRFDTKNALTLFGAKHAGFDEYNETSGEGYRGQPNAIKTNCWHCGNCTTGCWKKAKQPVNVAYLPKAESAYGLVIKEKSVVLAVLYPHPLEGDDNYYPTLVVYGKYLYKDPNPETGGQVFEDIVIQPTYSVILSGGAVSTPHIWLQSNYIMNNPAQPFKDFLAEALDANGIAISLYEDSDGNTLPDNEKVGRNLKIVNEAAYLFEWDKPIEMWKGQNNASRVDVPGVGMIESYCFPPAFIAMVLAGSQNPDAHIYGVDFKNTVLRIPYMNMIAISTNCEGNLFNQPNPLEVENKVFLHPGFSERIKVAGQEFDLPVPATQWFPDENIVARTNELFQTTYEMMQAASDNSSSSAPKLVRDYDVRLPNGYFPVNAVVPMSTMEMGVVVDEDCQAYETDGIFIVDASVLSTMEYIAPTHTIQALALRTAEKVVKYLTDLRSYNEWLERVGPEV